MNLKKILAGNSGFYALLVALSLSTLITVGAQEARGVITGKVLDANQSSVPGAQIKVTNTAMGTTLTAVSNDAGLYNAPYLLPGTYQISVEVSGFKKYVRDGVVLRVGDTIEVNIELVIGSVGDSVVITADAPVLETTSASMGKVVDSRRIAELPIGHGDPYALMGLAAGVTFSRDQRLDRPFEPTHIVGYAIDGTRANRSDLTIDGVSSTATANAGEVISSFVPPQDLVQEFKVQTATFDAQFGNTEGGVTNLSIKSGTNSLHGTLYYANFMPGTSANDYFSNRINQALPDFYYHRYGGTVGGPVSIPKLYEGKNKTFFMYGMEGIREARPRNNGTFQIATEKMRTGDFSELLAVSPTYQIYNPFSARRVGNNIVRDPFPGNIIPSNLINPIAKNFVDNFLPKPTSAATAGDGTNNFQQPDLKETAKYQSHTIRMDHVINDRHRIFARASWYDRNSDYNNYYRNIVTGEYFSFVSRQGVFDDVYTFSPTLVMNLRYGYNRFIRVTNSNPGNRGFDLTSLGFPSSYAKLISSDLVRFPRFDINSYQGTGIGGEYRPNDTHNFVGTLNKSQGSHSIKGGLEFRSYRETDVFFANNQTGQFNFDNTFTKAASNVTENRQLGYSFAAFLLGIPSSGSISQPANYAEQSTTWGLYVHDDWKVNSKLTLNLGLRYELEGALSERYNRSVSGFDYGFSQPFEAAARAAFAAVQTTPGSATPEISPSNFNVKGGLLFAGVGGQSRGLYETPKKNFMPRFGLAYKLNDKTVLRGGYGIFFGFLGQRRGDVVQSGFSANTPLNVTLDNGLTFQETLSNPFQSGLQSVAGASLGGQTFLGQPITFFNPNPLSPYNQRWQLSIQRELPWGFVGDIGYVGNRGTHIEVTRNINSTPNQYLSSSASRDQARVDYLSALIPNPFVNLMPSSAPATFRSATIARERLLRPFPQFDTVTTTTNDGYSWYHALQLNLEKRFSKGYTVGASYTFSKFMEAIQLLNGADPRPTEMLAPEDRPHRFALSGIYELPFGKGKPFLGSVSNVASLFVSGWQISGIYSFQSGPALEWGNVIFTGDLADIRLSGDEQTVQRWINTEAGFNRVANQQLDRNVRTFPLRFGGIRADKVKNVDLGIIKKTRLGEGSKELQFRGEFLNAFNHPLLFAGAINLTPAQAAFGQITSGTQANYPRRVQLTAKFLF